MTRVALDTNILVYEAGIGRHADDVSKIAACRTLVRQLRERATIIAPVQVLGELYSVLTRFGMSRLDARDTILDAVDSLITSDTTTAGFLAALDLATTHKFQIWDALILNAAAETGCAMLLSEDMGNGFVWRGTVVVNPLAEPLDDRLSRLLA